MEKDKRDKFEQLLMERLGEFREEPSEGLFDRIEATLLDVQVATQTATKISLWRRPAVRWALSAVAAAVGLFGVVLVVGRDTGGSEVVLWAGWGEAACE